MKWPHMHAHAVHHIIGGNVYRQCRCGHRSAQVYLTNPADPIDPTWTATPQGGNDER